MNKMKRKRKTDSRRIRRPGGGDSESVEINRESPPLIVSSAHLVSERCPELSEFEFGMILAVNAFNRWVVRCMAAAVKDMSKLEGSKDLSKLDRVKDMSILEALLLHHVHHQGRKKKLADICFMYNIEDTHVVSYSLKKLIEMELVESEKKGKEVLFSTTDKGAQVIERYRQVRENCLMSQFSREDVDDNFKLGKMARFLRYLSGLYDQAARAATSL